MSEADYNLASNFAAVIAWSDGTSSSGSIVFNTTSQMWDVIGTHTYTKKGTYAMKIAIADPAGNTGTASCTMQV